MTTSQGGAGRFSHDTASGLWEWDEEVFRIHGCASGSFTPTTKDVLGRAYAEDQAGVREVLGKAATDGEPFSVTYRVEAADGEERMVLLVCEAGVCGQDDDMTLTGYFVDQTIEFQVQGAEAAAEAVTESAAHRATIEQALGVVMAAYGLDADASFEMLKWWSQNKNVKLRDLAVLLVESAGAGELSHSPQREELDRWLNDITRPTVVSVQESAP